MQIKEQQNLLYEAIEKRVTSQNLFERNKKQPRQATISSASFVSLHQAKEPKVSMLFSRVAIGTFVVLATVVQTGATCINQADFDIGTLIIDTPGVYELCEDIVFKPNPPPSGGSPLDAFQPNYDIYDEKNYGLGFFAAISIVASGVEIHLNGHTISQSPEHALMQRFFALIELGSSPFLENTGPHNFGTYVPATDVKILGPGTMGLSSHHGIHGNNNANVVIQDVTFENFEVGAVSLNNADNVAIEDNHITQNRRDVPVVGMFSSAVFISFYGRFLKDNFPERTFNGKTSVELYEALEASIVGVYNEVIDGGGSTSNPLYWNPMSVVDGPCYAFVVHGKGPAVNGFGEELSDDDTATSR